MEKQQVITVIYQKGNILTKRNIKVLHIDGNSVKAYCYLRKQNRIFKKENILAADFCRERV